MPAHPQISTATAFKFYAIRQRFTPPHLPKWDILNRNNHLLTATPIAVCVSLALLEFTPSAAVARVAEAFYTSQTINEDKTYVFKETDNVDEVLQFTPSGTTDLKVDFKGKLTINDVVNYTTLYAIRASESTSQIVKLSFQDVDISLKNTYGTGITNAVWTYGGYNPLQPDPPNPANASPVTINGTLKLSAEGTHRVQGVVSGSDYEGNSYEHGLITLKGDSAITIIQHSAEAQRSDSRASGLLAYDGTIVSKGCSSISVTSDLSYWDINNVIAGVVSDGQSSLSEVDLNESEIQVKHTNNAVNHNLYGIEVNLYGSAYQPKAQSVVRMKGPTAITLSTNNKSNAYGIASFAGSVTASDHVSVTLDTSQEGIGGVNKFYGVYSSSGYSTTQNSMVTLQNGLSVQLPDDVRPGRDNIFAIYAGPGTTNTASVVVAANGKASQIEGNLLSDRNGTIDLALLGNDSYLTGWSDNNANQGGSIRMKVRDGAVWNVVSRITSNNAYEAKSSADWLDLTGGTLDMTYATVQKKTNWEGADHRQHLTLTDTSERGGLTGTGGTIKMDIDLAHETKTNLLLDQIEVKGKAEGSFTGLVNFVGGLSDVAGDKMHSANWLIKQGSGKMTVDGKSAGNGGMQTWSLKFFESEAKLPTTLEEAEAAPTTSSGNEGYWYLVRNRVDDTNVPPEGGEQVNVGTSTGQALSWDAEIEDLRMRLGEVRYGAQDGAWAKANFSKDRAYGAGRHGFRQETSAVHVGVDHLVATDEHSSWLVGGAFRYANSDQEGFVDANGGSGDLDQYSVKLYATWMHENGAYADLVLQTGYYEQDLEGIANDGSTRFTASYDTWGFGASVELGRMFTLHQDENADDRRWWSHWFLEPQAQLAYFNVRGADYTTSTGMKVSQENADFLTGRLGVVLGKKVFYGGLDDLEKRWFQAALMGGVKYEFLGGQGLTITGSDNTRVHVDAADMGGARWYYGFMADWQLSDDWRLYGQVSREEGSNYTREYDVHFGAKYQF